MMRYQIEAVSPLGRPGSAARRLLERTAIRRQRALYARLLNPLLLPVLLLLSCGVLIICLHVRFEAQLSADQARYLALQRSVQTMEYHALARDAVAALTREVIEHDRRTARVLLCVGFLFLSLGMVSGTIAWNHLAEQAVTGASE